jgi:hypothetical protein
VPEIENRPLRKTVFDVIKSRVDEYSRVVPCARLDSNSLMNQRTLGESLVGNRDG